MQLEIRANQLKPHDLIIDEVFLLEQQHEENLVNTYKVIEVKKIRDRRPRKILALVSRVQKYGNSEPYNMILPWDRRMVVERSDGPSETPEESVGTITPTRAPEPTTTPSKGFAEFVAEVRERLMAKLRKVIEEA